MAEFHHLSHGPTFVQPMGTGDTIILGFVPDGEGKFTSDSIRLLYFNPLADRKRFHVWNERYQGVHGRELKLPNPTILPDGSVFLIASDGGLEALFDPAVLSAAQVMTDDIPQKIIRNIQNGTHKDEKRCHSRFTARNNTVT